MRAFAPAKVNLYLHVGSPDADGFHPLNSLVAFADVGDTLTATRSSTFSFGIVGEFAQALDDGENLVLRAVDAVCADRPALALTLHKRLPVAAGLGGGTSDGAATLRLLASVFAIGRTEVAAAALTLGSDGPACLAARSLLMTGRGERLTAAPAWPALPAVLVNPRLPCSTAAVYRAFDQVGAGSSLALRPPAFATASEAIAWLATETCNDLEAPAAAVQPAIDGVMAAIRRQPEVRLARLSGSGATGFGLCATHEEAAAAAARLSALQPNWWVRACTLGQPPVDHEGVKGGNPTGPGA